MRAIQQVPVAPETVDVKTLVSDERIDADILLVRRNIDCLVRHENTAVGNIDTQVLQFQRLDPRAIIREGVAHTGNILGVCSGETTLSPQQHFKHGKVVVVVDAVAVIIHVDKTGACLARHAVPDFAAARPVPFHGGIEHVVKTFEQQVIMIAQPGQQHEIIAAGARGARRHVAAELHRPRGEELPIQLRRALSGI